MKEFWIDAEDASLLGGTQAQGGSFIGRRLPGEYGKTGGSSNLPVAALAAGLASLAAITIWRVKQKQG